MEDYRGVRSTTTAFVIGGILGAGIALLFAPQSGRKTRRDIRYLGEKAWNKTEALQLELRHSVDNLVEDVTERLHEEFNKGREWTSSTLKEIQGALESGRKHIRNEMDKIRRA